jgi:adenylate kinase
MSARPKRVDVCDQCGGALYQRDDDSAPTVRKRLEVYARETSPLLDHYRSRGLLVTVRGEGGVDEVRAAIRLATKQVAR